MDKTKILNRINCSYVNKQLILYKIRPTAIEKAIPFFQQHSRRLRTSEAIRLGIAPRTLYALRESGQIEEVTLGNNNSVIHTYVFYC